MTQDRREYHREYYRAYFKKDLAEIQCPCGCGRWFKPRTEQTVYFNRTHKCRVHNRIARKR